MQEQIMRRMAEMTPEKAEEIARQLDALRTEEEAWKVAQLAATLAGTSWREVSHVADWSRFVLNACALLAEARRQAGAPADGEG